MIDENYLIKVAELMDTVEYPKPSKRLFAWDEHIQIITVETDI